MLLPLILVSLTAAPAPSHKIAILDLEHTGVDKSVAETVSLLIPTQVRSRNRGAQVIAASEIAGMLGFERQRQLLGCHENTSCMAEIGDALGVDELVTGKLGQLGQTFVLELGRLDVRNGRSLGSVTRVVKGSADALVDAVPSAIAELFPNAATEPTPQVRAEGPASAHPSWSVWAMGGGGVLIAGGAAGAIWANSVADAVARQQVQGNTPTITRSQAQTAQSVYVASWIVGGIGVAAVATGVWGYYFKAESPAVTLAPLPGGASAVVGGAF